MKNTCFVAITVTLWSLLHATQVSSAESVTEMSSNAGFQENKGQIVDQYGNSRNDVVFTYADGNRKLILCKGGFSYELIQWDAASLSNESQNQDINRAQFVYRVDVEFVGANECAIVGEEGVPGYANYYTVGAPESGVCHVKSFRVVRYHDVYNGIDLEFRIRQTDDGQSSVKYDFIVRSGADPSRIKMLYKGASPMLIDANTYMLQTPHGRIMEDVPVAYQRSVDGRMNRINCAVDINDGYVAYSIGAYDGEKVLTIDPNIIWGTYYGGTGSLEYGYGIATLPDASIVVVGRTDGQNNIATTGAHLTSLQGGSDAFILRMDSSGTRLWGTYYGGSGVDVGKGVVAVGTNTIYAYGHTSSQNNIATAGASQPSNAGGDDIFITRFNASGSRVWGTYYGGAGNEEGALYSGMDVDASGNILITGRTTSSSGIATTGAYQTTNGGGWDAFVAKFTSSGAISWGTYYGGTGTEYGEDIASDNSGNVIVVGHTESTSNIASTGAHQVTYGGVADAFVAKLTSSGSRMWGSYYGGSAHDVFIGVETIGAVILCCGYAESDGLATVGSHQPTRAGGRDAIIARFTGSGTRQWATYYGGSGYEGLDGISAATSGEIYLSGKTASSSGIATLGSHQQAFGGNYDAMVVKIDSSGTRQWGTYYGGSSDEGGNAIVVDLYGNCIITGATSSTNQISTTGAHQTSYGGGTYDAFIAKFDGGSSSNPIQVNAGQDVTISPSGSAQLNGFASGGTPPYSYSWSPATGLNNASISNPIASPAISTTYTLTVTDVANNQASDQINVLVNTGLPLAVNAGQDTTISSGSSAQLQAVVSGGYPPYSYAWTPAGSLSSGNISNPLASPNATTTYYVTVQDANSQTASDQVTVQVSNASGVGLNFKRLTLNWPTVESYFSVSCNGNPAYNMSKQNFRLFEDGIEINDFTLWCPDPTVRCAISTALVFDASGSMTGTSNTGAKAAGRAFIDQMDGQIDEASVIWFNTMVNIQQPMTTLKPLLYPAVDALPASGGTAVWDGTYAGIIELINNGVNQCRAVIVLTDGQDNASTRTPAEVISLANRNRIRVFTIGLGGSINATELEMIALLTGGRYFQTPNASQLSAIYRDISTIMFQGFQECVITYERDCADGALHTTELQLVNFCGGNDTKTKTYRAPLDSTTYQQVPFRIDSVTASLKSTVQVPLRIENVPAHPMRPGTFTIQYDPSMLVFNDFLTGGFLLDGKQVTASANANVITIQVQDPTVLQSAGVLGLLEFQTATVSQDVKTDLNLVTVSFTSGCITPVRQSGFVRILSKPLPTISLSGPSVLCEGESVVLTAPAGYASYQWSTSDTSRSITVSSAGDYWVTVLDDQGRSGTSPIVTITVKPAPQPVVVPKGPLSFCLGRSVDLEAGGGTSFVEYSWSTGESTQIITADRGGWYWVRVRDLNGCWGQSDSVFVNVTEIPVQVDVSGPTSLCAGDSVVLSLLGTYASFQWSTGASTRSITVTQEGTYWVEATDASGCRGISDTIHVTTGNTLYPTITVNGSPTLCPGDSVELDAGAGYDSYLWSTGATTQNIFVTKAGSYFVEVSSNAGCSGVSDTIDVDTAVPPVISPAGPVTICVGGSVELDAGAGYSSYRWNSGQQTRTITVNVTGVFAVTVMDPNGCTMTSAPVTVNVVDSLRPTIVAEGPTEICEGETVVLDAGAGYATYRWSNGKDTRRITVSQTGVYAVTVTDRNNCVGISNPIPVTVHPAPMPTIMVIGNTTICDGDSVVLDAGEGYASYRWSNAETTRMITVKSPGSYTVTVWTDAGCDGTATPVDVTVEPSPQKPVISQNGNVLTTGTAHEYQWYKNGQELPGETNQFLIISEIGTYQVRITNENGCSAMSDPFVVTSTGIDRPAYINSFAVYPDPNKGTVNVTFNSDVPVDWRITVTNLLGQRLYERVGDHPVSRVQQHIDLQSATSGIYLLRIETGDDVWTQRIVRE